MRKGLLFFIVACICLAVAGQKNKGTATVSDERKRKADFIFMESQSQAEIDNFGNYFNLLRYARSYDPDEIFYDKEIGNYYMYLAEQSSALDSSILMKGYEMLKKGYENDPYDLYAAVRYASWSQRMGNEEESLKVWYRLKEEYPNKPEIAYNYADLLYQQGDTASIRRAIQIYTDLERSQGYNLGLTSQKVRAYITLRDTVSAIGELKENILRSPKNPESRLYAGDVYMVIGMPDSAFIQYTTALDMDSTNGVSYHKLAEYYQSKGDSAAYDREVFNALSQGNLEVQEKIELMKGYVQNLYTDEQQRPRIEKLFEVLTELHPLEPDIRDLYSVYLAVVGNYQQSAEQTAVSVGLNPSEITNWNRLISLYLTLNESGKAVGAGNDAIHYFPDNAALKLLVSSGYLMAEKTDSAIFLLNEALEETDPGDMEMLSDIETTLADAYYKMEQKDSAFVHYDIALKYNPANILAMNNCAYFMACEGKDLDRAEKLSFTTLRDNGDNPVYLDTYAWILFKKKKFEDAKLYIDKTLELDPEPSSEVLEHAGDIYFMNLMPLEALEYWKEALELAPDNELLKRKVKEKTYLKE